MSADQKPEETLPSLKEWKQAVLNPDFDSEYKSYSLPLLRKSKLNGKRTTAAFSAVAALFVWLTITQDPYSETRLESSGEHKALADVILPNTTLQEIFSNEAMCGAGTKFQKACNSLLDTENMRHISKEAVEGKPVGAAVADMLKEKGHDMEETPLSEYGRLLTIKGLCLAGLLVAGFGSVSGMKQYKAASKIIKEKEGQSGQGPEPLPT